ncbi:MAG TPA: biotin/lipoyl-containing protein, partial [Terriglobales bacterium]|nr:biotin/lipoyl-containing protein [Terriglobales bacterium]
MPRPFVLPDLGEGLTEAEIVKVLVAEGDVIPEDAPLLEVETDKAQVEIPSPMSGRVAKVHVQAGQTVKVGSVLVTFDDADGNGARGRAAAAAPAAASSAAPGKQAADTMDPARRLAPEPSTVVERGHAHQAPPATGEPARPAGPVPATPATRRLARELGVDLRAVRASGPGGRVTDDDVRAVANGGGASGGAARVGGASAAPDRAAAPAPARGPAKPLASI